MNEAERIALHNALSAANRSLTDMAQLDTSGPNPRREIVIRNCADAYRRLLRNQETLPLSPAESANVQRVLDRLNANLKFFGADA